MFQILDCTLRDGGYYTSWDFEKDFVEKYLESLRSLPVKYIELGYYSPPITSEYMGEYYYLPNELMQKYSKDQDFIGRFAVMLNIKDFNQQSFEKFLNIDAPPFSMVRIVVDPEKVETSFVYLEKLKSRGFKTALNLMYLSNLKNPMETIQKIRPYQGLIDYLYFVDSFGSCFPDQVGEVISAAKKHLNLKVGFHGHDNISLAFSNSISAINAGVDIIDSTILGMGRGAGNLKTELLLLFYQSSYKRWDLNLMLLNDFLTEMQQLKNRYGWGDNFAYMVSGMYSLPQKNVMSWLGKKRFNVARIVNHLMSNVLIDPGTFSDLPKFIYPKVSRITLIVGGGESVLKHLHALKIFIEMHNPIVVLSSAKYIKNIKSKDKIVALPGDEGSKSYHLIETEDEEVTYVFAEKNKAYSMINKVSKHGKCFAIAPFMSNDIDPDYAELDQDSSLGISLGVARDLVSDNVFLVGFDGYKEVNTTTYEMAEENQKIFNAFSAQIKRNLISLTPSRYSLAVESLYSKL